MYCRRGLPCQTVGTAIESSTVGYSFLVSKKGNGQKNIAINDAKAAFRNEIQLSFVCGPPSCSIPAKLQSSSNLRDVNLFRIAAGSAR